MKRYEINYNNDVYFKHLLSANDEDSERLRRTIITEQFHINYELLMSTLECTKMIIYDVQFSS